MKKLLLTTTMLFASTSFAGSAYRECGKLEVEDYHNSGVAEINIKESWTVPLKLES